MSSAFDWHGDFLRPEMWLPATTVPQPVDGHTLYIAKDLTVLGGKSGRAVAMSQVDGRVSVLEQSTAVALEHCRVPRTLDAHIDHLARVCSPSSEHARNQVSRLCDQNWLLPCQPEHGDGASISAVVVPTADRPHLLIRTLGSLVENLQRFSRDATIVVVDGSSTFEGVGSTANATAERARSRQSILYAGPETRSNVRSRLIDGGFDRDLVTWLIPDPPPRFAAGGVRNLGTLLTAGQHTMTVDDDVVCDLRTFGSTSTRLALVGHHDPRHSWWFQSRTEAASHGAAEDQDVLAVHESLLGRSLLSTLMKSTPDVDTSQACPHILQANCRPASRVRATWLGVVGDAGVYCPYGGLFSQGDTRNRMAADERVFRLALQSREVARSVLVPTITDEARLMLYCGGIDNSLLVPPFLPIGTGEDLVFGAILRFCDPNAFVAQLPAAVVHDSGRASHFDHPGIRSAEQVRLAEVVLAISRPWALTCPLRDAAGRMRSLARHLTDLSSLSVDDFRAHVRATVIQQKWREAARCDDAQAGPYAYPGYWKRAFDQYRDTTIRSIREHRFDEPIEFKSSAEGNDVDGLQRHMATLGRALDMWPDLWRFAKDNHDELLGLCSNP
jgi:hypothetical protein